MNCLRDIDISISECPRGVPGPKGRRTRFEKDYDHMEIRYQNKSYGMVRPVDLHVNCRVKRDENNMHDVIITSNNTDYRGGQLL